MGKMHMSPGNIPRLILSGELYGNKHTELAQKLSQLAKTYNHIELNLQEVDFLDSQMTGVIISQALLYKKQGKQLDIIINDDVADSYINELMRVCDLDIALENIQKVIRMPFQGDGDTGNLSV